MKNIAFLLSLLVLASCNSCNNTQPDTPPVEVVKAVPVNAPTFNPDSAYAYTKKQVDFGPRNMNSKGHEACAAWLIAQAKLFADTVYVQKFEAKGFDGKNLASTNIIASFNPQATTRVLLCSHWDSRPWADQDKTDRDKPILAASDGASGVATLMEVARAIRSQPTKIGIDIFFIDTEDYGYSPSLEGIVKPTGSTENSFCLGSQYWAANPHVPGYKADFGVLLDMVGGKNAVFTREGTSSFNASWVQDKVWSNAASLGYSSIFNNANTTSITDDHLYINQIIKIPTIDIIHYDPYSASGLFPEFWHTHADNMDIIDKNSLNAVGRTLLYTVYQYDAERSETAGK